MKLALRGGYGADAALPLPARRQLPLRAPAPGVLASAAIATLSTGGVGDRLPETDHPIAGALRYRG
jgi:hypothetical protein